MTATDQTIAAQVAALNANIADNLPADAIAAFTAEQTVRAAEGTPPGLIAPGTPMPDADLLDANGTPTTLAATRAGAPAVVVFYRGAWCPYCNITLRSYQQQLVPALAERGVTLIALSPQKPDGSLTMRETNELSYVVLSDPGNELAGRIGIRITQLAATREAQFGLGLDVAAGNLDGTDNLPAPTVLVLDADGVIRWLDVHPDYTTRTEPADILAALDELIG